MHIAHDPSSRATRTVAPSTVEPVASSVGFPRQLRCSRFTCMGRLGQDFM